MIEHDGICAGARIRSQPRCVSRIWRAHDPYGAPRTPRIATSRHYNVRCSGPYQGPSLPVSTRPRSSTCRAQVIGDVEIGEESSVWMNAVVRGDVHSIRIGAPHERPGRHGRARHAATRTRRHRRRRDDRARRDRARLHDRRSVPDRHGRDPAQRREIGADSIVAAGTLLTEGTTFAAAVAGDGQPRQGAAAR